MDNLPEDQQRNDSPPSSPEPEGAVAAAPGIVGEVLVAQVGYPDHQEVVQEAFENLNIQQPPEVEHNVLPNQQQQPLLLRHASVSSLDESSQKYRERYVNVHMLNFWCTIAWVDCVPQSSNHYCL